MNHTKHNSRTKHSKITDDGIGFNRLLRTNYYLNDCNIFNKNCIKMNEIRKKINEERKLKTAEKKKGNTMPKIIKFSTL